MCASFSDDDVGKTVVNASGQEVGMVTAVEHGTARVKPDPGITDSIKAALGWEGAIEGTYPLQEESIDRITHDEIRLTGDLHEGATGGTMEPERASTGEPGSREGSETQGGHDPARRGEGGLTDPARDERTESQSGSREREEGSEAMDPDVGDGSHDDDVGISDRDRGSRDRDSDDSDRS